MIGLIDSWDVEYNGTENEARFQLVCDSAAELSSLTHYDSIKIRIGSECTDIATGDKYLKSSSAWVLQPSANAWENVYTKAQVDSMYSTLYQTILYYHTTQTSTGGTITFYAFAGFVGSLAIYGNGQQTGTPTPDNPVMPTFCGMRTWNLYNIDAKNTANGYIDSAQLNQDGTTETWTACEVTEYIEVTPSTEYVLSRIASLNVPSYCIYDTDKQYISGEKYGGQIVKHISVPSNGKYIRFSHHKTSLQTMLNLGSTALPYEPFGWAEKITCAGQTVPVYLGEVPTVRRVKKMVLDGTENWIYRSGEPQNVYFLEFAGLVVVSNSGLCTHYQNQDSGSFSTLADKHVLNRLSPDSSKTYIAIRDSSFSLLSDFKAYLAAQYAAGNPVTVWYVLATPTTGIVNEPLCKIGDYSDELSLTSAIVSIPTADGENTLTVDTDLAPSKIEISGER